MTGRLIINADDLGLSREVNAGILWGLTQGCISDTSVLIGAPHGASAVEGLRDLGIEHAGIHIDLDAVLGWSPGGRERLPRETLMAMLDEGELDGALHLESRSQVEAFLSTGLRPSHIDTHHHVHGFTPVFRIILDIACEYRIPAIRFSPTGYRLTTREDIPFDEGRYAFMHEQIRTRGLYCCDRCIEGAHRLGEAWPGVTEVVVHPSQEGDPWRSAELDVLRMWSGSPGPRGMELVSFQGVATGA